MNLKATSDSQIASEPTHAKIPTLGTLTPLESRAIMAVSGLYMSDRVRLSAVRRISAYGECVLRDLMPAFADLEKKADAVGTAEYERLGAQPAGDDWDGDMSVLAEAAEDKAEWFYSTMSDMSQAILNLFAVGLFHLLEQELANLCIDGAFTVDPPLDSKLERVAAWYSRHFQLDLSTLSSWPNIDELRLVANVAKHAEGSSARQLRESRPTLFQNPVLRKVDSEAALRPWPVEGPLFGEGLYVTAEVLQEFVEGAVRFASDIAQYFDAHGEDYYPVE